MPPCALLLAAAALLAAVATAGTVQLSAWMGEHEYECAGAPWQNTSYPNHTCVGAQRHTCVTDPDARCLLRQTFGSTDCNANTLMLQMVDVCDKCTGTGSGAVGSYQMYTNCTSGGTPSVRYCTDNACSHCTAGPAAPQHACDNTGTVTKVIRCPVTVAAVSYETEDCSGTPFSSLAFPVGMCASATKWFCT